jgi:hypothetical protein
MEDTESANKTCYDGIPLEPLELYQTLAWGVCPQNEWLVRVTASYYDLVLPSSGKRETTMVEVRIQISYLTRPLSPNYRETSHHLKLFDGAQDEYPQSQPQVVVSEDRRNLAVLLFHPHQQSSAVVIFQLRIPRSDLNSTSNNSPIPLPFYCANKTGNDNNASSVFSRDAPAVATHPRFVSVWGIATLCSIPNVAPPVFLGACHDGSFVWLDARSSLAVATGMLPIMDTTNILPFSSMVAAPSSGMAQGTLLCVSANSGHCLLVKWQLESTTPVQQTFLKRASTGTVVIQEPESSNNDEMTPEEELNPRAELRRKHLAPRRTSSAGSAPAVQRSLKNLFSPKTMRSTVASFNSFNLGKKGNQQKKQPPTMELLSFGFNSKKKQEEEAAKLRKEHMDTFVLKELQTKTPTGNWESSSSSSLTVGQKVKLRSRRRRSDVGVGDTAGKDTLKRSMQLEVLSTLQEEDHHVVEARFASLSTIVCVVYRTHHCAPQRDTRRVAQVYSICEAGTFQPMLSLSLSMQQIKEHAISVQHSSSDNNSLTTNGNSNSNNNNNNMPTSIPSRYGLDHDPRSDSFAISTLYDKDRWIGCLWNWRNNVLGWMIQNNTAKNSNMLWSRFYFGTHPQQGSHFVYLESTQDKKYIQTHKQVVATGLLSPPNSSSVLLEPCSLLLASDSISFPGISQV